MRTSRIGYAYASSPLAEEHGHGSTGCWYLEVCDGPGWMARVDSVTTYRTQAAVATAADRLGLPPNAGCFRVFKRLGEPFHTPRYYLEARGRYLLELERSASVDPDAADELHLIEQGARP